jgi:hypothetical protein
MQLAVTPFGKNRPYPPMKPLVLMKKNDKLPLIGVTKPKSGFRSGPGSTNSKYHPILSPDRLRDFINHQSQISLHIAVSNASGEGGSINPHPTGRALFY